MAAIAIRRPPAPISTQRELVLTWNAVATRAAARKYSTAWWIQNGTMRRVLDLSSAVS